MSEQQVKAFFQSGRAYHQKLGRFAIDASGNWTLTPAGLAHLSNRLDGNRYGIVGAAIVSRAAIAMREGATEFKLGSETYPMVPVTPGMGLPKHIRSILRPDLLNPRTIVSQAFYAAVYVG